jgi:hypothetical protein
MTPEEAFRRAWGRAPARSELERIYRLQSAFGIDDNDAFLTIAMVLELYDGHFRVYPEKCAAAAATAVRQWLQSPEGAAVLQRASVGCRPSSPRSANAGELPPTPRPRHLAGWPLLLVIFVAGAVTGAATLATAQTSFNALSLGHLVDWLAVPVVAAYAGAWGWEIARDRSRPARHRWAGWGALIAACASIAAWLVFVC